MPVVPTQYDMSTILENSSREMNRGMEMFLSLLWASMLGDKDGCVGVVGVAEHVETRRKRTLRMLAYCILQGFRYRLHDPGIQTIGNEAIGERGIRSYH